MKASIAAGATVTINVNGLINPAYSQSGIIHIIG